MKKLNKVLALVLAMVMALSLAACSGGNNSTNNTANAGTNNTASNTADNSGDTESTDSGKKLIAGVVFQEDQFFKLLSAGYQAAADEMGYEIQLTNTNNDQSKETEALNTYVAQGVAGVAISPLNTQVSPAAIEDAHNSGMEIAICNAAIDAFPYAVASYSADNYAFCKQTGEAAVKFIQENYSADETLKIGVVQFKTQVPEQSADRVNGFFAALDEAGIKYDIVADQDAWLQDMAVETAGKAGEIFVFGTDGSEQIVDLLKADNNILQAVTAQDAFQIGYSTVEALINTLEGNEVEGAGQTNIIPGIPLVRGDDEALDSYLADLQSMM